jgi:ribokinase
MTSKPPRIVVVGSSNTDLVVKSDRLPRPGETVTGGEFLIAPGGKGANQAVAAARLGAAVALVAKVGDDAFGQQAVAGYRQEGIDTEFVLRDAGHPTGVALILVDQAGENLISVASGANHALRPADVERAAPLIRQADVLVVQLEIPYDSVACAAGIAARAGVLVVLDPAPAPDEPLEPALLRLVTHLKPNENEAQRLTGIRVTDEPSARSAAQALHQAGARSVVVTLGARGALWSGEEGAGLVEAPKVSAIDSTAAGDAFSAALACGLARGLSLAEAVKFACTVGALTVTRLGAQPSLPTRDDVERFASGR